MPGPRQPVDRIIANGRKHMGKAEEAERRAQEVNVPKPKSAKPPKWLPEEFRKDFRSIGKKLIAAGIYTDLDADTLGRYLVAHDHWLKASEKVREALESQKAKDAETWGKIQDRHFKQARNCANDMGLTVTSRCRMVVPPSSGQPTEDDNPFLRLMQGGAEKRA